MIMKTMLMRVAVIILKAIYIPFIPIKMKNKIVILSRQSDRPTVDIRLLKREFDERGIENIVLARKFKKTVSGGIKYGLHMVRQMYHISSSKLLILDGHCILASILYKKKGQKIVQIWHALGAVKKFGYQSVGKPGGNSAEAVSIMKLYKNYDYVIAPSEAIAEYYSEAFNIAKEKIALYGLPRIDYLIEGDEEKTKKIEKTYPQLMEKENILYVPTFRKNGTVDIDDFIENARLDRYNLVIRRHWLDKTDYTAAEKQGAIIDRNYSFFDWLKYCNKVITDYSAAAFEAAILEKELYFYIKDISDYECNVGLNIDLKNEAIAMFVYSDSEVLWDVLGEDYDKEKLTEFKKKYITVDTENCTRKLADFLLSLLDEKEHIQ